MSVGWDNYLDERARREKAEAALTEAHRMLQEAWALLPPEDGERLGIVALLENCHNAGCERGEAARASLPEEP